MIFFYSINVNVNFQLILPEETCSLTLITSTGTAKTSWPEKMREITLIIHISVANL